MQGKVMQSMVSAFLLKLLQKAGRRSTRLVICDLYIYILCDLYICCIYIL